MSKKETVAYCLAKEAITFKLRDFLLQYKQNKTKSTKQTFLKKLKECVKIEIEPCVYLTTALEIDGYKTLERDVDEFLKGFVTSCFSVLDKSLQTLNDICNEYDKINQEEENKKKGEVK